MLGPGYYEANYRLVDTKPVFANMGVTSRESADTPHLITQFRSSRIGPGSYEITNLDIGYNLSKSLRKTSPEPTSPSKDESTLTTLSKTQGIHHMGNKNKTKASKSQKKLFKLFIDKSKALAEDSANFRLYQRLANREKLKENRLNLESNTTPADIGPGTYEIENSSIARKLDDYLYKKETFSIRNQYQNYVFPSRTDFLDTTSTPVSDQLHLSSQIKRNKANRSVEIAETQESSTHNASEQDYYRSKIAKLGSLYDKIRLRETLAAGTLHPAPGEYRQAPMANMDIYN